MLYINKITGATINTKSILGGAWEPEKVSQVKPIDKVESEKEEPKKKTMRKK